LDISINSSSSENAFKNVKTPAEKVQILMLKPSFCTIKQTKDCFQTPDHSICQVIAFRKKRYTYNSSNSKQM